MQHEHHRVPVTAVTFRRQDVILAGEGSLLKIYSVPCRSLLVDAVHVLGEQAIHGICVNKLRNDYPVIVYGGRYVCAVLISEANNLLPLPGQVQDARDWILDAAFNEWSDDKHPMVAIVTAHNALVIGTTGSDSLLKLNTLVPGSNCILYAAHVTWLSHCKCLVASGTAFGDVIVWSCQISCQEASFTARARTHYTFSAHDGSVFGVQISSPDIAATASGRARLLATCSDDRSIRLWDVSDLNKTSPTLTEEQQQTGFGSRPSDQKYAPPLLGKVMGGHLSRVWKVQFLKKTVQTCDGSSPSSGADQVNILSFGEDASCITWGLIPNNNSLERTPFSFQQLQTQKAHAGKNIWSVSMNQASNLATGGADGAITLLSSHSGNPPSGLDRTESVLLQGEGDVPDNCRAYAFVGSSEVLVTTNQGRLVHLLLRDRGSVLAREVSPSITGIRGYSVMAGEHGVCFVAGNDGIVYKYTSSSDQVTAVIDTGRKVAGLFTQTVPYPYRGFNSEILGLLVTNVGSTTAKFCLLTNPVPSRAMELTEQISLDLPLGIVVTSFTHVQQSGRRLVVVGSRTGSVAIFDVSSKQEDKPVAAALLISAVHGKETVTCLRSSDAHDQCTGNVLLSVGRDGTYAAHRITVHGEEVHMQTIHHLALPFGPNVEGLEHTADAHIWAWGFRSKQFMVFDINSQREIMTVECGGVHRSWIFRIEDENGGTFVWTKASKVYYQNQSQLPYRSINPGGHGREIKCTAVSYGDLQLIATGAEDTDIKLSRYIKGEFKCLHTLRKHTTGIQHLAWSSDSHFLFSSGGFEEFFLWKINYDVPRILGGIGVFCESSHPQNGQSDLRIMGFDVQEAPKDAEPHEFKITMIYSDSSLRVWQYTIPGAVAAAKDRTTPPWKLLSRGNYLTSCLTQCAHASRKVLLTASTDGHLAVWNSKRTAWTTRHRIHQSAILSLALPPGWEDGTESESRSGKGRTGLVVTGGDDNAIGITRVDVLNDDGGSGGGPRVKQEEGEEEHEPLRASSSTCSTLLIANAHAAAVTALAIVPVSAGTHQCEDGEKSHFHLLSAGLDQRLKLWRVDVETGKPGVQGIQVRLLRDVFTAVADVSSSACLRLPPASSAAAGGDGVLVSGVGMDVWRLEVGGLGEGEEGGKKGRRSVMNAPV